MKFGKLAPRNDYRTLKAASYFLPDIPAPPPAFNTLDRVLKNLNVSDPTELFPMDGNDNLGDCTYAGIAHATTLYNGMVGVKHIPSAQEVIDGYLKMTGGKDTGLYELDVLNHWHNNVTFGSKILGFAKLDHKNIVHIKQAIQIFGAVYLGFQVTENCLQQFEKKERWTPGRLLNEGHAVLTYAYTEEDVSVFTWGDVHKGTWQWWNQTVDEAYVLVPHVALLDSFQHINYAQLQKDLKAISH